MSFLGSFIKGPTNDIWGSFNVLQGVKRNSYDRQNALSLLPEWYLLDLNF